MAERHPIIAHCRSASGTDLTRSALDFALHAGGDVLWIAYVPESVRGWFERFADSVDRSDALESSFQLARLFDAPSSDDLKALLDRVEARRAPTLDAPTRAIRATSVARIADEIDRGKLHVTGLIFDVHHVPTFARQLRAGSVALPVADRAGRTRRGLGETASLNLISILRRCHAADINVIVATVESTQAVSPASPDRSSARDDAPAVLAVIGEVADLTVRVEPPRASADRHQRIGLSVGQSRYPDLRPGTVVPEGDWETLLMMIRPRLTWTERLARAFPREIISRRELRESAASWSDPVQDEFVCLAGRLGWRVSLASGAQDRGEHWDVCIERGGESYRVDVKARSKIRRHDPSAQDNWHWVELRGIVDGGWLFGGMADLIAFHTSDSFLLVRREELAAHVRHHVDPDNVVDDPRRAEYRVYRRPDRDESARAGRADRGVLTLIPTERLRRLAFDEWPNSRGCVCRPSSA